LKGDYEPRLWAAMYQNRLRAPLKASQTPKR